MIPDTTDMSCVDEYLQEMFSDKTDAQLDVTDCTERKASQMQERDSVQPIDNNQYRCDHHHEFHLDEYYVRHYHHANPTSSVILMYFRYKSVLRTMSTIASKSSPPWSTSA